MFCYLYIYASPSKNIEDIHSLKCNSSHLKSYHPNRKVVFQPSFFRVNSLLNLGSSYTLDFRSGRKRLWRRTQVVGLWCRQACDSEILRFASNFISVSQISCHRSDHVRGWMEYFVFFLQPNGWMFIFSHIRMSIH